MRFRYGDLVQDKAASEEVFEGTYIEALEKILLDQHIFCDPDDEEAEAHVERVKEVK